MDSAMFPTHSWFDVTVLTTLTGHQNRYNLLGYTDASRGHKTHLQNQLLHSASSMDAQQREEKLEMADALGL